MKNKILVEIFIPQIDEKYNIYLPLNKNVANIIILISKAVKEINSLNELDLNSCALYNAETGLAYSPELIVRDSNIRNSSRLILM